MAQEEQSALPAGVINTSEDSDDDGTYLGDREEVGKMREELQAGQHLTKQRGWDVAGDAHVVSKSTGEVIDLHLDWGAGREKTAEARGEGGESTHVLLTKPLSRAIIPSTSCTPLGVRSVVLTLATAR